MASISGGDKLAATLKAMAGNLDKASSVDVGFLEGAKEADGTSIPMIAAIQEFGAPKRGIPPRPFFRTMIKAKSGEWPAAIAALLKENGYDTAKTLDLTGQTIAKELFSSIADLDEPALSAVTVMLRGMRTKKQYENLPFGELIAAAVGRVKAGKSNYGASTKPLIDSGNLQASIDYIVK